MILRLPGLAVPPTVTLSSNSPPIFLLHRTQTSVSGITSSLSFGISAPQILQFFALPYLLFKIRGPNKFHETGAKGGNGAAALMHPLPDSSRGAGHAVWRNVKSAGWRVVVQFDYVWTLAEVIALLES